MALFDKFTKKKETPFDPSTVLPRIFEVLAKEGYCPERDKEVRVMYKTDGLVCYFYYREDDPEFLLVRATFDRTDYERYDEALLLKACSRTDYDQKVGKAYLKDNGDIVLSVEAFIMPGVPIERLALRMNKVLRSIDSYFHRTLKQLAEVQEAGRGGSKTDSSLLPPSRTLPS